VALAVHAPGTLPLEQALEGGLPGVEHDDRWLTDGGIKLFADGGTTAHAAAFYEPYADEPSTRGRLAYDAEQVAELFAACHARDRRVSFHAVGDRAQDVVLDGFEAFARRHAADRLRHRVEHAGNLGATDGRLARYRRLGLVPVPNPTFVYTFGAALEQYLGPQRARRPFRFRSMLDMGFTLPGSSDCTGPEPLGLSPLFNAWCLANRRTARGTPLAPEEAISVQEALELLTRHAAFGLAQERERGTLEKGKLADFVVLSEDPLGLPPERVRDVAVDLTYVDGKLAHRRPGAPLPREVAAPPRPPREG
jgi:predicted amidohydrolase YtcJ